MRIRKTLSIWILGTATIAFAAGTAPCAAARAQPQTQAQDQHVVPLDDLNRDAAQPAQTRQADEAAIRGLLKTGEGQQALKQAKVDYARVDKAIGQLSDEDVSKLGARSRQAQSDFAAGGIGGTLLIVIILIIVLAIVLSVVF
jgi:uncharacterized membrane protein YdfJ with MMPL/SSD domain